ncbi:MAG: hypothetical protein DWP92_03030 [Armatimonadetes bacterium]|nr:MAG: hypothetical protein DWP92_03030 [Armatimonadota bacterium]
MLTPVSTHDPKPGRWILPVVIVALIGFTYLFVNALPAADVAASTSTTSSTSTTLAPTTTTSTTLPNAILAFLQEVDRFEAEAIALQAELDMVNEDWENRDDTGATLDETKAGFEAVRDGAQELSNQVAAAIVPEPFPPAWPDTIVAAQLLVTRADEVIDGLLAPDDGSLRRQAVTAYGDATTAFTAQLDTVRALTP